MQISNVHVQGATAEWARRAAGGDSAQSKKENGKPDTGKIAAAQVSLSAEAGKNSSAEALVKARADALPEVREEKIAVARERIASGYYNTAEFRSELASRLVDG
ncbi:MAG: flagellar biosynthesis anti-sigma factor FlgM [Fibromonadales bacterium]|nr:flagellar biosynthesis anti-sigma factor FlgM [Fibromonadales bacterium]